MKRLFLLACAMAVSQLLIVSMRGIVFGYSVWKKKSTPLLQLARYSPLPIAHLSTCDQESGGKVAATDYFIAA